MPGSPVDRWGRLALCPTRFGAEVVGGAEIVLRTMAIGLRERGWDVDVLTTCATDHHSWANVLPAGESVEDGLRVRRFPARNGREAERQELERRILDGERLSPAEQQRRTASGMRVPQLHRHLRAHARRYRALVFPPSPSWVTYAC